MENNKQNEEASASLAIEKLGPAIDVYKKTFAANRERVDRAILVTKAVTAVTDDEPSDLYANRLLVKCNTTLEQVKGSRLLSTKILDDAKAWAMEPEKELIAEMERIKKLRNDRAKRLKEKADQEAREIELQKVYDTHRGQVKARMKESLELGIASKLKDLENALAKLFNECTLEKVDGLGSYLDRVKPSLREDFFDKLLTVDFDQRIMSVDQFQDTKDKGKAHFNFEKTNAVYVETATKTIASWRERIPAKKSELERIAKASGEEAARLKEKAERARLSEETKRKEEQALQEQRIKEQAEDDARKAALEAEFESQVKTQEIAEQEGTRKTKSFRLDAAVEVDMVKLSSTIGKLVLHVMLAKEETGGIFKRTKAGEIKLDSDGQPEYVEGVQYWLDQMKKIKYTDMIPGIISTEKISTVAKVKA